MEKGLTSYVLNYLLSTCFDSKADMARQLDMSKRALQRVMNEPQLSKVSGWISSIWDGICDFFGIHSPSKEMGWIGEMLVEGLAGSLDKNGKTAVRSAEHLADGISSVMQGMTADMQAAIPSHINMDTTLSGLSNVGRTSSGQAFNVTIPLTIDGTTLARILAEIQWTQNAAYIRNLGMA